jgi:hypothetical protein
LRSRHKISDASNVYFITITTHCWVSIIFNQKQKNKLWQEGYHPEAIFSEVFFLTKLNYISNTYKYLCRA